MNKHLPDLPKPKRHRPVVPDSVVLDVALRQGISCGCGCARHIYNRKDLIRDHHPPLALREYDPKTRKYVPDANDPRFLQLLLTEHSDIKTNGGPAKATTAGSDIHNIRKASRLAKSHADHQSRMAAKLGGTS
jgi:hypothetical protein